MKSTNTVQPKEDHRFDHLLEDVKDGDGEVVGKISHIPRRVITTTNMKARTAMPLRSEFPGVNKRETRKVEPGMKFTTENLNKLQRAKASEARATQVAPATPAADAPKATPKKRVPGRKRAKA